MLVHTQSLVKKVTPVISTSIYASGDQLGGINELTSVLANDGSTCILQDVTILDKAKQKSQITLFFFNDLPTVASSDNAALNITDAEMEKCIGKVTISASDYTDLSANSVATLGGIGVVLKNNYTLAVPVGSKLKQSVWMVAMVQGTPTYGTTSDLVVQLGLLQD